MARSVATLAALTLMAVAGCTTQPPQATPGAQTPAPTGAPASSSVTPAPTSRPATSGVTSTPTSSTRGSAKDTPRAQPTSASELPGTLGELPSGFTLPDEDQPAEGDNTPYQPVAWAAACADASLLSLSSVSQVTATRIRESQGPEHVQGRGLVQFRDEDAARAFVDEVNRGLSACPADGDEQEGMRTHQELSPVEGVGDQGIAVRLWTRKTDGADAPGASLQYIVRKGRHVALVWTGGEYLGDPVKLRELVTASRDDVEAILTQV